MHIPSRASFRILEKPVGYEGIAWTLAGLYIISAIMTYFIREAE